MRRLLFLLLAIFVYGIATDAAFAASIGLRPVGSSEVGTNTVVNALPGSMVTLELYVDTEGLTLEGYSAGIDIVGGIVSGITVTHQSLSGLNADLFGTPVIDETAGTIRGINQVRLAAGPGLSPGVYVTDLIEFTVQSNAGNQLTLTPGLFGEVLGLGEGSCPGTVAGCDVAFFSVQVVPEPSTGLLLTTGLLFLGAARRKSNTP